MAIVFSFGRHLMFRILDLMFTRPVYLFSWIALIGLSITQVLWLHLALDPSHLILPIHIFCGIITANIAKRKGKSTWLWFFIGLIAIGIPFLFALSIMTFFLGNLFPVD